MINRTGLKAGVMIATTVVAGSMLSPAAAARPARTHAPDHRAAVLITWNRAMIDALERAQTPAPVATRVAAIVQTSVFDAVNGVTRRFQPYHVTGGAPAKSNAQASVIGAAHEALSVLFPAQTSFFNDLRTTTLATVGGSARSVARSLAWGRSVADEILAWRSSDGVSTVPPPYVASSNPGRWQPTPPLFTAPAFRPYATMTPWAIDAPSAFRPPPPPALTSHRYAADYAEVRSVGALDSTTRTADEAQIARLWNSDAAAAIWDRVADTLLDSPSAARRSLTDAARVLAQVNIAMADAVISIWNAKNYFDTWRPITAIRAGDTDGNPATTRDVTWQPLLVTPPFQEYPAGHPGVSQAAATVLAAHFGNRTAFTVTSPQLPDFTRAERSFSAAAAEVVDARVWGGIHFRSAGDAARTMGRAIGRLVLHTTLRRTDENDSER